jgi:hypothetical protein
MIPKSMKIGGYTVAIVYVKGLISDEGNSGNFNERTMEISMDPDLCEEMQYGVLYHELIEAVKSIYHIECLKTDHHAISQLGEALHQILRDNGKEILP